MLSRTRRNCSSSLITVLEATWVSFPNEAKLLKEKRRFSEDLAKMYISEIVSSIECLHENNVIYRDLKPENIVFDSNGHAILTDFGLSKEGVSESDIGAKSFCG
jgi:serine/threonine protein kinase